MENIKLLYKSRETIIEKFNDYSSIVFEAIYNAIHGKGILSMSARVACGKVSDHSNLKILSPKQMLQKCPIALVQVKPGNASENWLNEIRQTIYYLYWKKEVTKKVYNNIMNSIKL